MPPNDPPVNDSSLDRPDIGAQAPGVRTVDSRGPGPPADPTAGPADGEADAERERPSRAYRLLRLVKLLLTIVLTAIGIAKALGVL